MDIVRFNPAAGIHALANVPADVAAGWGLAPGFACPVRYGSREPFEGPLRWLLSIHDGARYSVETNRAYAHALKPTLEAIEIEGRPWDYVDDEVMTRVTNALVLGTGRLGKPITGGTIECYLRAVDRCARYTNEIGMTSISLDIEAHVARGWGVATMRSRDGKRIDTSHLRTHMIRPLDKATRERIEAVLLMDPRRWRRDGPSSRPAVGYANGCRNGLRLIENLGVMVDVVRRYTITDPNEEFEFPILRTKGADERTAYVFGRDILRWQYYIDHEREACVKAARDMRGSNWDEPCELLVNGLSSGLQVGLAAQPSTIQRDFRMVQRALGMVEIVEVPTADGGVREVEVYWHCYHDLRHTYAHSMYRAAKRRTDDFADDPIRFVQIRLGHADLGTTAGIYLWPDPRRISKVGDQAVAGVRSAIDA